MKDVSLLLYPIVLFMVIAIAASVQSVAGMGFGMIAVPVLVLFNGPLIGVLWGNVAGLVLAVMLTVTKWRDIEWSKAIIMSLAAPPAVLLTVLCLQLMSRAYLEVAIGALMLAMVIFSVTALKFPAVSGTLPLVITGLVGGFLSSAVAQSGPAMAAYAQASRWQQKQFAATIQPYFLWLNLWVVPLKIGSIGVFHNMFNPLLLLIGIAALFAGLALGKVLSRTISPQGARGIALSVATIGALSIFIRGIAAVAGYSGA